MIKLNIKAPMFKAPAFYNNQFREINLESYKGKYVILFFYPKDFTFVCPTELEDMAENYAKIKSLGAEVLSVSTDTEQVHLAWHNDSPRIGKITFPMIADPTHEISKAYEVLRDGEGVADRATIVIDPEGLIKMVEITDEPIGRNATELLRKLQAMKYSREHPDQVCPAKWNLGDDTLKPGEDLVGKL